MSQPDFTLPDPQRAEFERRYKGMKRPHFRSGDVTMCRPMTEAELYQYRQYREEQGVPLSDDRADYQIPF